MESWVVIKRGTQISKVPYQAYKDLFERQGFEIVDQSLSAEPTFSHSADERCDDSEQANTQQNNQISNLNKEVEKASERFRNNQRQNKKRHQ
mgnify:CR=1 FL=1